jgi:hypothetical protein
MTSSYLNNAPSVNDVIPARSKRESRLRSLNSRQIHSGVIGVFEMHSTVSRINASLREHNRLLAVYQDAMLCVIK